MSITKDCDQALFSTRNVFIKNSDSDFCTGHRHILYKSLMVKKSLSRFYSYPYFTGALMIRLGRDVLTLSGGLSAALWASLASALVG